VKSIHLGARFDAWLDRLVRAQVLAQFKAKAFSFAAYADAESGGESAVFDRALARAEDPELARMMRVHRDDELRHAALFEARARALALPPLPVPDALKTIERLSEAAGGVLELPMDSDEDVATVYQLLFVVEERALAEFGRAAAALERLGDSESAAMLREIAGDEARHLRYCRAVGRRYSGGDAAFEAGVEAMRAIERRVYAEQSRASVLYMLDRGWLRLPGWSESLLRAVVGAAERLGLEAPDPRGLAAA